MRICTERRVRMRFLVELFLRISRNDLLSISQSAPSVIAVTLAARGLEYMSASSPKHGFCAVDGKGRSANESGTGRARRPVVSGIGRERCRSQGFGLSATLPLLYGAGALLTAPAGLGL